jgi:hypothetical protein
LLLEHSERERVDLNPRFDMRGMKEGITQQSGERELEDGAIT